MLKLGRSERDGEGEWGRRLAVRKGREGKEDGTDRDKHREGES